MTAGVRLLAASDDTFFLFIGNGGVCLQESLNRGKGNFGNFRFLSFFE
jgi:hypothetical protein